MLSSYEPRRNGQEGESDKHFALMPRTFYVDMDGRSRGQQRSLLRICHITEQKTAGAATTRR